MVLGCGGLLVLGVVEKRAALALGYRAETFVVEALRRDAWNIRARNWRGGGGELDIVCARGRTLRFVEVKARTRLEFEPIRWRQQQRLIRSANAYLADQHCLWSDVFFSVALVACQRLPWRLSWIDDAFDSQGDESCHFG